MICILCGVDIDAIGQDNVSLVPGRPVCETCATKQQKSYPEVCDWDFDESDWHYPICEV